MSAPAKSPAPPVPGSPADEPATFRMLRAFTERRRPVWSHA